MSVTSSSGFTPREQEGSWEITGRVGNPPCPTVFFFPFIRSRVLLLFGLLLAPFLLAAQTAVEPAVQAILFYSPSCPHCHQVINELLIPMQDEYGDQLHILGIDTSIPAGQALYGRAIEHFEIPQNRLGVPTLIIDDTILVGSMEIPEQFPGIVEEGFKAGGVGWPDIPDLALIVPDLPPSAHPADPNPVSAPAAASSDNLEEQPHQPPDPVSGSENMAEAPAATAAPSVKNLQEAGRETSFSESAVEPPADPVGFALAWLLLIGMAAALAYALRQIIVSWPLQPSTTYRTQSTWLVPLLALLGLAVALYLSYVEVNQVSAVCGPVGECNIVQSSPYAQLFGIPIAVLGALSYLAILALWAGQRFLPDRAASLCSLGLLLTVFIGTLFSIYLTCLELFVIKAICLWCLSSAVIMTLLLILAVKNVAGESLALDTPLAAQ